METIERSIEIFLKLERENKGMPTVFCIDYEKGEILLHRCTSGQLKRIMEKEGSCASLHDGVVSVTFFKR